MNRITLGSAVLALALASPAFAQSEAPAQAYPAILSGHAVLPAETFIPAPADAPLDLQTSGKYTTGKRVDALGTVMGKSFERETGVKLPFKGQPIQGHSGIKTVGDGTFWVITDNGFGSKANSPDSMLYLNRWKIDFTTSQWTHVETIFLHDFLCRFQKRGCHVLHVFLNVIFLRYMHMWYLNHC